ncbi:hypothetical protein [Microbacterium sp. LWH11-1.2]|uniref:hypothetical protein n=1 Tax=Microbacterium sp. LWH11-1.2 TaxID=3135258 RepID=UPI00313A3DAD
MPGWIVDLISVAPWLAAAALLVWVALKVWPFLRKITHFIDDVAGEPARPGFEARPGLMERLSVVEEKQDEQSVSLAQQSAEMANQSIALGVVQHEVTTNHGSSLKDAVKSVVEDLDRLQKKFDNHLENNK